MMRLAAAIVLLCVTVTVAGCGGASERSATRSAPPKSSPAPGADGPVVLGSKNFVVWGGLGFGTPHPSKLAVGSDPSVLITGIRWHGWGGASASGVGRYKVPHFGHGGDYYRKGSRADLRVSGIGRCQRN